MLFDIWLAVTILFVIVFGILIVGDIVLRRIWKAIHELEKSDARRS